VYHHCTGYGRRQPVQSVRVCQHRLYHLER
jgi:hypothetical protein